MVYVEHSTPMIAFWRIGEKNKLHMGIRLEARVGDVHDWPYKVELCTNGLHACLDAEKTDDFRKGTLCKVACSGWMKLDSNKLVCSRREILRCYEDLSNNTGRQEALLLVSFQLTGGSHHGTDQVLQCVCQAT